MCGGDSSFSVEAAEAGERLDVVLSRRTGRSRSEVRRLLEAGRVEVDGRVAALRDKGTALAAGARLTVVATPREALRVPPEPEAPLRVLSEGPGWLAVEKPAGSPVHPLREGETGSVLGAVVARHPELQGVGEGGLRSGVVHRLDVETSGALLVATRQDVWERLRSAFRAHRVDKRYRAIVLGWPARHGDVRLPLIVSRHRPARVTVAEPGASGARATRLGWRRLEIVPDAALVEVRLVTGFLHQIRASFAHLGHPVAGDRRYGPALDPSGAPRLMLHAARLALDEIRAESPDPPEFTELRARLRRSGAGVVA